MPLVAPNLDQRTFEQIVAEVRRRIPTLTPEWTDLNEGDPGITLAELFAFMSEQLLFQVNQVPNKGFVTFLKMVGVDLHPASPAITDVTFAPKSAATETRKIFELSAGTRVQTSGPPPGEKEPVGFETIRTLPVLNGTLADVVSRDCTLAFVSHRNANDSLTQSFRPFGKATSTQDLLFLVLRLNVTNPGWPAGRVRLRVNLAGSSDVGDPPEQEFDTGVAKRLTWSFASGVVNNADGTQSLVFSDIEPSVDSTNELTQSGYLEFDFDSDLATAFVQAPSINLEPALFADSYVLRARLARADAYQGLSIPEVNTIRLNTVPARAVTSVTDEQLGGSSGLPFQRFRLANAPVVPQSVTVTVPERGPDGASVEVSTWLEVADLYAAGPDDEVFQLFPGTGELLFGNGQFGRIPPPDDAFIQGSTQVVMTASYQFGGGLKGNVGVDTLKNVALVDDFGPPPISFEATNVLPAVGGAEEEGTDIGLARAPAVVRSRFRAVTTEDFEALARETPDVRVERAFALASTRPGVTIGGSPGSVTVLLVPFARFEDSLNIPLALQPSIAASVLRFLDQRRLITTEVFTAAPRYRRVRVATTLVAESRTNVNDARNAAISALQHFFHPLVGGLDGTGWPFGGTVFFSRVFERLLGTSGIARAERLLISLDDNPFVECQDLPLGPGDLLYSGDHNVVVIGG